MNDYTRPRGQNPTRQSDPRTVSPVVDHVLITRFNLPTEGPEGRVRQREGWLTGRVDLFEKYCLPSVRAQTNQNFRWLIYFDPDSPEWLIRRLSPYVRDQVFEPIYRAEVTPTIIVDDIRSGRTTPSADLLTTNLDNDDGLAADFVDRLQRVPTNGPRSALYLASGLILGPDGLFLRVDKLNAFCSVRETWDDPVTCWADWHTLLPRSMPSVTTFGPPAWLQVVHGSNVSNRVRGRLVSSSGYAALFPSLPGDLSQPTRADLLRDRLLRGPVRLLRESCRAAVKDTLLFLVGKSGVDKIKAWRGGDAG